jgi:hypothetical protein
LVRLYNFALKSELCGFQIWYQLGVRNLLRNATKLSTFIWSEMFKRMTVHIWSSRCLSGATDVSEEQSSATVRPINEAITL